MVQLIDCRQIALQRFEIEKGYQPKHALFFLISGEIEFYMAGERSRAGENTLLSFPAYAYFERRMLQPTTFYYVRYEAPGAHDLPVGKVELEDTERLLSTLRYLVKLSDLVGADRVKNGFLADIFHQIEAQKLIADAAKDPVVVRVQYFFEKNLHRKITLTQTAQVACLSLAGLNYRFKKSMGLTPMEYLTVMRLKKAEALLHHTKMPIAGIAALCGYESPFYFSNTFKKHRGESPSEYRSKYNI